MLLGVLGTPEWKFNPCYRLKVQPAGDEKEDASKRDVCITLTQGFNQSGIFEHGSKLPAVQVSLFKVKDGKRQARPLESLLVKSSSIYEAKVWALPSEPPCTATLTFAMPPRVTRCSRWGLFYREITTWSLPDTKRILKARQRALCWRLGPAGVEV